MREGKRRGWEDGVYQQMRDKLSTDRGRELYAQRNIIEPVFGQSIQPAHRSVHAKRPGCGAVGVAVSHRDSQFAPAPQPLDHQHRLTAGGTLFDRRDGLLFARRDGVLFRPARVSG